MPIGLTSEGDILIMVGDGDVGIGARGRQGEAAEIMTFQQLTASTGVGDSAFGLADESQPMIAIHFGSVESIDVLIKIAGQIRDGMASGGPIPGAWDIKAEGGQS